MELEETYVITDEGPERKKFYLLGDGIDPNRPLLLNQYMNRKMRQKWYIRRKNNQLGRTSIDVLA